MATVEAYRGASHAFSSFLYYPITLFVFSLPGWVIGLPFVVTITNISRWRFWLLLGIGTGIGPFLLTAVGLYMRQVNQNFAGWAPEARNIELLSGVISVLTTAGYLILLKYLSGGSKAYLL